MPEQADVASSPTPFDWVSRLQRSKVLPESLLVAERTVVAQVYVCSYMQKLQ